MFDIGVNLTHSQFAPDVMSVIERAQIAGVTGMLLTGTTISDSHAARILAQKHPDYCWSTAGVHPHYANQWSDGTIEQLYALSLQPEVVAIGECGLDFYRNFSTSDQQEYAFSAQLKLAAELKMPVFLHCRDAYSRFIQLLTPWRDQLPAAVLHCFTGTQQELRECLALGLSIGITGWVCDERRGVALRSLLPQIPIEQLLLETDAPYLLPRDMPLHSASHRNEPSYLPHIVRQVAVWRHESPEGLGAKTDENARRIFQLTAMRKKK